MSTDSKQSSSNQEKAEILEERQKKINAVRTGISPLPEKLSTFCSDASIARYLRARGWNIKKATKMLKDTLKWRGEYIPEEIRWEDVASEAESGKMYRSTSFDKKGRPVLVMRPCRQNSNSVAAQIKYFVYCIENAILNLPPNQEQMVWLVDFLNFNLSNISVKSTKETAHVLQNHYPERLGVAIMYNPPRIFEQFYTVVKPFLEPKTRNKVKFVYADDPNSKKIMYELFEMDQLECAFGGEIAKSFDIQNYAQRMKEDDDKMRFLRENGPDASVSASCNGITDANSLSDEDDPSEKEEETDASTSPSTGEDSQDYSPDISLSVNAMSLAEAGNIKAC